MKDGDSGLLFCDPRLDGGVDFEKLLLRIISTREIIDPRLASDHLAHFSFTAFSDRLRPIIAWASALLDLESMIIPNVFNLSNSLLQAGYCKK